MRMSCGISILVVALATFSAKSSSGQASLPSSDFRSVSEKIRQDFGSIDQIRTVGMTDEPGGRFDIIVIGSRRGNDGWRVEVLSLAHHRLTTKWDSLVAAKEPEISKSGSKGVTVKAKEYDYDILIEGCAPHSCYDGVSGFLIFSAKSNQTSKAKLVTQGLDRPSDRTAKYDVTFSKNISDSAKQNLEEMICRSPTISARSGLPFSCESR